ncbi:MAG: LuxR C-terminal-related transcriptional regulator [Solirubrobacteraceae bacterium]
MKGTAELATRTASATDSAAGRSLVVVTDNPMMMGAIRSGLSDGKAFRLLGYLDSRRTTAAGVKDTGAEVVLVEEASCRDEAIDLIRRIKESNEDIAVALLAMVMDRDCLERAFEAGASSVILKAIHPSALATFLGEALQGNIVHSRAAIDTPNDVPDMLATEHLSLTSRELAILRLVAAGATNHEIAQQLWITRQTVKFHLSNIYRKLGVNNRTGACHYAHRNGMMAAAPSDAALMAS